VNSEFESIGKGLREAEAFAKGSCEKAVVHE
jgi:hypothetical protein